MGLLNSSVFNFSNGQAASWLNLNTPSFLLSQNPTTFVYDGSVYNSTTILVDKNLWVKFFFLSRIDLPCQNFYVVDGIQHASTSTHHTLQFNTSRMLTDLRVHVYTSVSRSSFSLPTVSTMFTSTLWLERELSDFSNLNFIGLVDTRRLLLDYFEPKQVWSTHISNDKNYNNIIYEVSLVF